METGVSPRISTVISNKKPIGHGSKETHVAIIVDKSGSMSPVRQSTVSTVNEMVQDVRKNAAKTGAGETFFTLVLFDGSVNTVLSEEPMESVYGELDMSQYVPSGGTALNDALGLTVHKLQRHERVGDIGFLVIVISDGLENSSKKYDRRQIKSLIEELEGNGRWTFQYIGCDPTAIQEASQDLGFDKKVYTFNKSDKGLKQTAHVFASSIGSYYGERSRGVTSVANLMAQGHPEDLTNLSGGTTAFNPDES
jgi:uncharacterized protein YegL